MSQLVIPLALLSSAIVPSCLAGPRVLVAGSDENTCLLTRVVPAFSGAGFEVTTLGSVDEIPGVDLSDFDAVWLPNGIDATNPFCPDDDPVPSQVVEDLLAAFVADGGGLYLAGENASDTQTMFQAWRDAFIRDRLGGGDVEGVCDCNLGSTIYLDPVHPINAEPNPLASFAAGTEFTGGFFDVGNGTPVAYGTPTLTGLPITAVWDVGDLSLAPTGRLVVVNNSNNSTNFPSWAVNAINFLTDPKPCNAADLAWPFCTHDLADITAFTTGFVTTEPIADLNADGVFDLSDITLFVTAFVAGCP